MKQMTKTTGNTEWYTPSEYIEAARAVLGAIDLDPASCAIAQRTVQATRYFTAEDDGLLHDWSGRVFLNPPYAGGIGGIECFINALCASRYITAYITLTNDCMDTAWAHKLLRHSSAVCFVRGRIRFETPGGAKAKTPPRGQMFCYHGGDVAAFKREFAQFGIVVALR